MVYLSSYKKPESSPLLHPRDTLLRTPDQTRMVVSVITGYVHLFILDFCIHVKYAYNSLFL
jgi:hypothetical protein